MDQLLNLLSQLGLGIATNAIYDLIKSSASKPIEQEELLLEIQNRINLSGVNMRADTVISALSQNGFYTFKARIFTHPRS